jgi:hypothetical protein
MKKMPGEEACPERRSWLALHFLSIRIDKRKCTDCLYSYFRKSLIERIMPWGKEE